MTTNGNKIKQLRNAKALTQELLAEKAGVTTKTIQRAEAGNVSPTSRLAIARALEISPEDIFLLSTNPETPTRPGEENRFETHDKDMDEFLLYLLEQEELQRATNPHQEGHPVWFVNDQLKQDLGWGVGRINDVVQLAEQRGWVFLSNEIPGSNFNFVMGYLTGEGKIFADPSRREDPKLLLQFLANQGEGEERGYLEFSVPEIEEGLSWDRMRVEEAIEVLEGRQLVDALAIIGSPSYFNITLTRQGRRASRR